MHIPAEVRDLVRDGAVRSADVLAGLVVDWFHPGTVVDVGCGEGHLPAALRTLGVESFGLDGDDIGCDMLVDFNDPPYPEIGPADVATCLEVAEHVEPGRAADLVAWLVTLAPIVCFSAAIPHQGGAGHINEQPPGYWADLFASHGYIGTGQFRHLIWNDTDIEPWYRQNLIVFTEGGQGVTPDGCPYLVHPDIWEMYRR